MATLSHLTALLLLTSIVAATPINRHVNEISHSSLDTTATIATPTQDLDHTPVPYLGIHTHISPGLYRFNTVNHAAATRNPFLPHLVSSPLLGADGKLPTLKPKISPRFHRSSTTTTDTNTTPTPSLPHILLPPLIPVPDQLPAPESTTVDPDNLTPRSDRIVVGPKQLIPSTMNPQTEDLPTKDTAPLEDLLGFPPLNPTYSPLHYDPSGNSNRPRTPDIPTPPVTFPVYNPLKIEMIPTLVIPTPTPTKPSNVVEQREMEAEDPVHGPATKVLQSRFLVIPTPPGLDHPEPVAEKQVPTTKVLQSRVPIISGPPSLAYHEHMEEIEEEDPVHDPHRFHFCSPNPSPTEVRQGEEKEEEDPVHDPPRAPRLRICIPRVPPPAATKVRRNRLPAIPTPPGLPRLP